MASRGLWFPRVEAFCQYRRPARFNDPLEVKLTIEELKNKSAKLGFRVSHEETGVLLATGYVIVVAVNKQTGRATQIPDELASKFRSFVK